MEWKYFNINAIYRNWYQNFYFLLEIIIFISLFIQIICMCIEKNSFTNFIYSSLGLIISKKRENLKNICFGQLQCIDLMKIFVS